MRAAVSTRLIISLFGAQIHRAGGSRGHRAGLTAQYSPKITTQEGKDGLRDFYSKLAIAFIVKKKIWRTMPGEWIG